LAQESAQHAETLKGLTGKGGDGEPWHRAESGGFLRNVVYGFNDGLTANFGLVAGAIGADIPTHFILVTGLAGLVADALSMGSSGYLAAKSQQEVYDHEIEMEKEEMRLMPEVEQEELALIYEAKGHSAEEAREMAARVMRDPEKALQEKVREELKIVEAGATPLKEGIVTGTATAIGALLPVLPFFFLEKTPAIWASFSLSMLSHFGVGAMRSLFTGRGIFRSGIDMFVVGFGVAAVAYFVGDAAVKWLGGG
jgi:vacuolar iron transporter family protein